VRDLLAADPRDDRRRLRVARGGQLGGEARGVVEVAALEAEADERDERGRRARLGHALPEPVAHREVADLGAEGAEVIGVQAHVARLVERQAREAPAEGRGRVGKGEDRAAEQLGGLQLVAEEGVQQRGPAAAQAQRAVARRARRLAGAQRVGAPGRVERERRAALRDAARGRRRRELVRHGGGEDVVVRPGLERAVLGPHGIGGAATHRSLRSQSSRASAASCASALGVFSRP
jgi:hypothetical protein